MFGYVTPAKPEMKVREFESYRSVYCGLCKQLKRDYGFASRMLLNYDLVTVALLADGLSGEEGRPCAQRCIASPLRKRCMLKVTRGLRLAAAALVLLVYPLMEEADRRPRVLTAMIGVMVLCSAAFIVYLYLRGDTGTTAEDTANYVSALQNAWKLTGATLGMLAANILDRRYIRFETQAVWWAQIIKLVVGFGLLLAIRAGLKAPLIALCGGVAEIAGGIRYLLVVLFAGCVWPLTFWGFSRLGKK